MKKTPVRSLRFTHLSLENWRNFNRVEVGLERCVFLSAPGL